MKKIYFVIILIFFLLFSAILYFQFSSKEKNKEFKTIEKESKTKIIESIPLEKPPFIKE